MKTNSEVKQIREKLAEIAFKYDSILEYTNITEKKTRVIRGLNEEGFTVTARIGIEIKRDGNISFWNKAQNYASLKISSRDLMEMCNELSEEFEFLWPLEDI